MTAWYNTRVYGVDHYSAPTISNVSGSFSIAPQFNGGVFTPKNLVGTMPIIFGINNLSINYVYSLTGSFNISPIFQGLLNNFNVLGNSSISIYVSFSSSGMNVGPMWQAAGACPDPGWAEVDPCNG
jgi:hypothetical protein